MGAVDLSVEIGGVSFKNPVLPGASELALDEQSALDLVRVGVGGIVTKSFTSQKDRRVRVRPYQFPLRGFGNGFEESGSLYSLSAPHVEEMDRIIGEKIPRIAAVCRREGVPLVVSFYESFDGVNAWAVTAKRFEEAGANLLELNFSSPSYHLSAEEYGKVSGAVIRAVAETVEIPVGPKISPMAEPLSSLARTWVDCGAFFITAHNAPSGIMVDVEDEVPYGAPAVGGYVMGRTFLPWSLARIVQIQKAVDIPVIGVGGIFDWSDAVRYILCGCPAIQICSSAYFRGLRVFKEIQAGIVGWMERKGYDAVDRFRGKVLPHIVPSSELKSGEEFPYAIPPDTPYIPLIDQEKCTRCLACQKGCLYKVFEETKKSSKNKMLVHDQKCWSCGFCVGVCPEGAIVLVDRKNPNRVVWSGKGMARSFIP